MKYTKIILFRKYLGSAEKPLNHCILYCCSNIWNNKCKENWTKVPKTLHLNLNPAFNFLENFWFFSFFSYFLLEQKVTKIQGFRKICCVSNPEVLSRNTRHESLVHINAFVVAVYCYAHAFPTYLRQEPLTYFSEAGLFYESGTLWDPCRATPSRWASFRPRPILL